MRMDILYMHILQIIIKCDWTLNEAIHEIFVKHLKCIKIYRVYFDYNVYFVSVYWNNWIYCSYCAKITRYLKCLATSQVDCTLCLWVENKLSEHLSIWHCFVVFRPSVHLSHFTSTKQYLLNYPVHSYHQKVKIIYKYWLLLRWIRDSIFQAKDVFTSHARWIRLLLKKYYHVFTSTKVNICILLFCGCNTVMSLV